jgi:hypothetical protein
MHSTKMKRYLLPLFGASAAIVPVIIIAQAPSGGISPTPARPEYGVMYFNTNVGSFKILGPGEDKAAGTISFACNGSVLISGLEGNVQTNLRRELVRKDLGKEVYFGKGTMTVNGKFSAIQFFGRDLRASWNGFGIIRLFGEFDKDLNTGEYWYAGNPQKRFWSNGGMTLTNPEAKQRSGSIATPKVRGDRPKPPEN